MTDKELLELAAKAAGINIFDWTPGGHPTTDGSYDGIWNPLNNDGYSFRLAVKLGMIIDIDTGECATSVDYTTLLGDFVLCEGHRFDPYAATRRAIVRAAAEMGRDKP